MANIRGGGEYGEELWYAQGKLTKKQNVFDDFQYAAKYLVSSGYTKPARLAINGGSNGGLLVGACINQAPELFGCAIADVGVMDMYTFHKWTIGKQKCGGEWIGGTAVDLDFQLLHSGHAWVSDYGNPDKLEDFLVLQKYSPVQ